MEERHICHICGEEHGLDDINHFEIKGETKKVAEAISNTLACDIEEIIDTSKRTGPLGFLLSGYQAMKKKLTVIEDIENNPSCYNIIIIGTPVWVKTMSTPVRTYLDRNWKCFNKVAFFCTYGGTGAETTFHDMEGLCSQKPVSLFNLRTKEIKKEDYIQKVKQFISEIE